MSAIIAPLAGIVYVCGVMLILLTGLLEVRSIIRDEPERPWKLVALAWFGAALGWPAIVVIAAGVVASGEYP